MLQQSHFWVFIQRTGHQYLEEIPALLCPLQHYSQEPRGKSNLNIYGQLNEQRRVVYTYRGLPMSLKKKEILPFVITWA